MIFSLNLGRLFASFNSEFDKNFRDLPLEVKFVELKSFIQTFLDSDC